MKIRKIKYIITVISIIAAVVCLAGCSKDSGAGDAVDQTPGNNATEAVAPEAVLEKLYTDIDVPPYEVIKLNESNFEAFAFIPYDDSLTAASGDALVNVTPHSVVVIHAKKGNGAELAGQIVEKADPNKWLCVGAEAVRVTYTDHYVVLIMSDKATADAVAENFKAAANELDGMEPGLLTATNSRYEQ